MKIINIAHVSFPAEHDPEIWIGKSLFFKGIWEALAQQEQVIFIDFIHHNGTLRRNGLEYRFLKRSPRALRFPLSAHRMIARERPDVVIVHGMQFPLQVLQLRMWLPRKTRLVVQDHGGVPLRHPLKQLLQRLADRYIDAYFFTAAAQAALYTGQGIIRSPEKVKEIMEISSVFGPGDRGAAQQVTGVSGDPAYLWIGHLNHNKDPLLALKAFCRFAAEVPQASLYMIYQSTELLPALRQFLETQPSVKHQVQLVGKVDHEALVHWLHSADFILSTSHYEAAGVSVTEGMSCGCIPVLSDIAAFRKMTAGHCGILFETGKEYGLLQALRASAALDRVAEKERTVQQFRRQLSFDAVAAQIRDVLRSL